MFLLTACAFVFFMTSMFYVVIRLYLMQISCLVPTNLWLQISYRFNGPIRWLSFWPKNMTRRCSLPNKDMVIPHLSVNGHVSVLPLLLCAGMLWTIMNWYCSVLCNSHQKSQAMNSLSAYHCYDWEQCEQKRWNSCTTIVLICYSVKHINCHCILNVMLVSVLSI